MVRGEAEVARIKKMGFEKMSLIILENVKPPKSDLTKRDLDGKGVLAETLFDYDREVTNLGHLLRIVTKGKVVCKSFSEAESLRNRQVRGVNEVIAQDGTIFKGSGVIVSAPIKKAKKDLYGRLN